MIQLYHDPKGGYTIESETHIGHYDVPYQVARSFAEYLAWIWKEPAFDYVYSRPVRQRSWSRK